MRKMRFVSKHWKSMLLTGFIVGLLAFSFFSFWAAPVVSAAVIAVLASQVVLSPMAAAWIGAGICAIGGFALGAASVVAFVNAKSLIHHIKNVFTKLVERYSTPPEAPSPPAPPSTTLTIQVLSQRSSSTSPDSSRTPTPPPPPPEDDVPATTEPVPTMEKPPVEEEQAPSNELVVKPGRG